MALDPGGVTVEKGNILKAGEVLLRIRSSIILWQVGILPVEGSSSAMISSLKGTPYILSSGAPPI
ncbi:UNVERIFIED_CONTAM: hypothetical protein Slati_2883200 [Sesamum latifolium]|uniref:Uncharacterized protein n=1 Tax=Sesamum latifolium TaxID=2727402 RepID=A0AAW2VC54_9LAMI